MFLGSNFNCDISRWNVSGVKDMSSMFSGSVFNRDIEGWDIHNVFDFDCIFYESRFKQNLYNWALQKNDLNEYIDPLLLKFDLLRKWIEYN
jgi:hypothetical protein